MLGFAFGLAQLWLPAGFGFGAGWETMAIARELGRTGAYANPFAAGPTGATAVIAPLFPAYLAVLIKLFGDTPSFALAAGLAAVLAQSLHAALLPRVSTLFFGSARPGVFAGVLSAVVLRPIPQWDSTFTACGLLLFLVYAHPASWRATVISGVAGGALVLTNPATVLITAPWMVYSCARCKAPLVRIAGFTAAVILIALPWMLRNDMKLGTFSVKNNFGMTIYASNNDCAQASLTQTAASGCYDARHPNTSVEEVRILNELGEAHYDRLRLADTVRWARLHRSAFVLLSARRVLDFWLPPGTAPYYTSVMIWLATVLSIPGAFLLVRHREPICWYLFVVGALYPLLYYVVVSDVRYRYPLLWVSLLCAGYLLSSRRKRPAPRYFTVVTPDAAVAVRTE